MSIRFACPHCNKEFKTADDTAGKRAKCGKCGNSFLIPAETSQVAAKPTASEPAKDDFDAGVTMRPRQPLRAQPLAPGGDEFDMGATLAPRRPPTSPPPQEDFDHGATMPRAKPDTAGSHAQADTHQNRTGLSPSSDLPLGSEVDGRYLVITKLGQGGMGAVYKVVDKDTQTEFALKVLAADLVGSPEALTDLKKEVAIAQQLTHQNLLRVNYLGSSPQLTYLLMEYIDGEDLETYRLRHGGKLSAEIFRRLMPQLLEGLEYLHNKGIVHLDIKPQNIMVSKAGELKLTDFGVSRSIKEQVSRRNQEQDLAGTLRYMAPEQIRKQVCDRRADIYALGIVFYQILTGRLPFVVGDPKAIAAWHLGPDPDPAILPVDWRPILQRCLTRDPAARFGTCKEILPFIEEQKMPRVVIAMEDKEVENLRILLEANEHTDAASLAVKILARDARNGLAWAAKAWASPNVADILKCHKMAALFAPNDVYVARERVKAGNSCRDTVRDQLSSTKKEEKALQAATAAIELNGDLRDEVMGFVAQWVDRYKTAEYRQAEEWLRTRIGNDLFDQYLEADPHVPGAAKSKGAITCWMGRVSVNISWSPVESPRDCEVQVLFDHDAGTGTICGGFDHCIETTVGIHSLTIELPDCMAKVHRIEFDKYGEYSIVVTFDRDWWRFDESVFMSYRHTFIDPEDIQFYEEWIPKYRSGSIREPYKPGWGVYCLSACVFTFVLTFVASVLQGAPTLYASFMGALFCSGVFGPLFGWFIWLGVKERWG